MQLTAARRVLWIGGPLAAVIAIGLFVASGGEGFGWVAKIVDVDRVYPPDYALAHQQVHLVFEDKSGHAGPLRQRIEELIRAGDPRMKLTADAPYVLTVDVRNFLAYNTKSTDGTVRLEQRQGRVMYDGNFSASNAGALISESDGELIDDAAQRIASLIVPRHSPGVALVPKGQLRPATGLAARGDWPGYLAAVDRVAPAAGRPESYRLYAIALAHEGLAYAAFDAGNLDATLAHIREAIARNRAAAEMNPSDQRLVELHTPARRILSSPCIPPMREIEPHDLEQWESLLRVRRWSSAAPRADVLDDRGVIDLVLSGTSDDDVMQRIAAAPRVSFELEQADMTALDSAGVSWDVIDAMRKKAGLGRRPFHVTPDRW